jgi:hypothetical protein
MNDSRYDEKLAYLADAVRKIRTGEKHCLCGWCSEPVPPGDDWETARLILNVLDVQGDD